MHYIIPIILSVLLLMPSCTKRVENTQILVQDSIRHYNPLVQGMKLTLYWRVANVGSTPLVLTDIQPSCGCIIENTNDDNVVSPGQETILKFTFDSSKYNGYVHHTIRLFGNIEPQGMSSLSFDLNVMPANSEETDYEEISSKMAIEETPQVDIDHRAEADRLRRDYKVIESEYPHGLHKDFWKKQSEK